MSFIDWFTFIRMKKNFNQTFLINLFISKKERYNKRFVKYSIM